MTALDAPPTTEVLGSITPRIWTPPLVTGPSGPCGCGCALSRETTLGFEVDDFARGRLRRPLDPWERWLVIHGMEKLPNGWPRFRQLLVLVARQNGKTELLVILSLFWMWVQKVEMVLGTSTKLDYSRESWLKVVKLIRQNPDLAPFIAGRGSVRSVNGEQEVKIVHDPVSQRESRYKIAAANEEGGRSLTVNRLVEDEIRQHHDYSAHAAAENTMNAVDDAQAWAISNEGDDRSVVLHDMYEAAEAYILTGEGDERLGLFVWSAPDGCDLEDEVATAQANPNLGRRIRWRNLVGKARQAKLAGGELEAKYRTEVLCQRVDSLNPFPVTVADWRARIDAESAIKEDDPVVFAAEIALDRRSASIGVAGWRDDGTVHVGLIEHRLGTDWLLPRLIELASDHRLHKVLRGSVDKPRYLQALILDPLSPAGELVDPLRKAKIEPVLMTTREVAISCGGMQDAITVGTVWHRDQPAVDVALTGAVKRDLGDGGWAFGRKKSADVSVDITPMVAVTNARWGLSVAKRSYRLLDSVH